MAFAMAYSPCRALQRRNAAARAGCSRCTRAITARVSRTADLATTDAGASRRAVLLSGIAVLSLALAPGQPAEAYAAVVPEQGVEEYARLEDAGKLNTGKALESIRAKYGFKRAADGRVYVRAANGTYYAVRLDMEVPGGLLLRNTSSGEVFALQTQALQQVDLTSDQVVILVLGDGEWENAMSPITVEDEDGATKTLTLKENEFRNVVGLISMTDQGQEGEEDK